MCEVNMQDIILLKQGEIVLKGLNKKYFEQKLISNVKRRLRSLGCTEAVTRLPVLRPLIGFDKEEIVRLSRKIGTFELSTLPYEDCCTVFTPRHPRTRPRIDAVEEAEAVLDIEGLVAEAMAGIERVRFDP